MTPIKVAPSLAALFSALSLLAWGCALQPAGIGDETPPLACTADEHCDDQNPCTLDTCGTDGLCASEPVADGASPEQTSGDCKTVMCSGGQPNSVNDNDDIGLDDNDCTFDTCNNGQDFHTAKPDGTSCTVGAATGVCGFGTCKVSCGVDLPPCDDGEPCTTDLCDVSSGTCIFSPLDGVPTPGATDAPGDCRKHVCVSGKDTDAADDIDIPKTATDCDNEICTNGVPSNPPRPSGTFCGMSGSSVCDGMGVCVQCNLDADCAGTTDECQKPVCVNHTCMPQYTPTGTPVTTQVPGDCKKVVCDGAGGTMSAVDDMDLPVDGNPCTGDVCMSGVASNPNLAANTPCGMNGPVCDGMGNCKGCLDNTQCTLPQTCGGGGVPNSCGCTPTTCAALGVTCGTAPNGCGGTLVCNDNTKNGTETDVDCGGGTTNSCGLLCAQGKKCTNGGDCTSGFCVDGVCCNAACSGSCQACTATKKGAGSDGTCGPIANNTDPDNECADQGATSCGTTGSCDGQGACAKYPNGTVCTSASCADGMTLNKADLCDGNGTCVDSGTQLCTPLICSMNACAACTLDTQCGAGNYCDAVGNCVPKKAKGGTCTATNQCATGNCVDGYCCDTACGGLCQACSAAKKGTGANGDCGPIGAATDPDNECVQDNASTCGQNGWCNGMGACSLYPNGTVCVAASCTGGTASPDRTCNGSGTCQTVTTSSCAPYICGATACLTSCTGDTQCTAGNYCNASNQCVPKLTLGSACMTGNQCGSGNCIDGVCCNTNCTGTCMACSMAAGAAVNGTCGPVANGQDPANECATQTQDTCGTTGVCNGAGACAKYASGTECMAASCMGDTLNPADTCDGGGVCVASMPASCAPYTCLMGACKTSCTGDGDCAMGSYCDTMTSTCKLKVTQGGACTVNTQCGTGICVDGVCCNAACTGACMACSVAAGAAVNGTCGPVANGQDPSNDCADQGASTCGNDGVCDGAGACRKYASGTVCAGTAMCSGDTLNLPSLCDGSGTCVASTAMPCDPYGCNGGACRTSCTNDGQCAATAYCSNPTCFPKKATGQPCGGNSECISGSCTANVCD